ncbi:DUF4383 domain-containing protein [Pseudanabaena sp. FACHB-2040]|uniref:DUF4383 domain-containing protein n=1 Tax=Pseudanabaena sp. FACHB-2040 TaxID=2692859 RepID=UPI00168897D9|nr:DUF4383 domain-containing protein [Pseudanabaena sp. FACHB-2040]MBD2256192.1 DUF4383 domain-containing protein [Pseudanabaena sp. FACHB-2040]
MGARYFALIAGVLYILVGLMGFVPGMVAPPGTGPDLAVDTGYGYLLGIFPINLLHNLVHLAVGVWGLTSYRGYGAARAFAKGLAIFYGVLAIMGLIPGLNTTFGLIPIFGHDVWLHALTALVAAYFGFSKPQRNQRMDYRDRTAVSSRDRY